MVFKEAKKLHNTWFDKSRDKKRRIIEASDSAGGYNTLCFDMSFDQTIINGLVQQLDRIIENSTN